MITSHFLPSKFLILTSKTKLTSSASPCVKLWYRKLATSKKVSIGESLKPFVDPVYSYAYGRSSGTLVYRTINQGLNQVAKSYPSRAAIISDHQGISKTFQEFNHDVQKLSSALTKEPFNLKKGDVSGSWSTNLYEYFVVQHALARLGVINCSVSPVYKKDELQFLLQKSQLKTLFMPPITKSNQTATNDFHGVLSSVNLKETNLRNLVFLEGKVAEDQQDNYLNHLTTVNFDSLIQKEQVISSDPQDDNPFNVHPEDPLSIFFTSGTTGKPKGAMVSHYSTYNNIKIVIENKKHLDPDASDKRLCVPLPLFHVFAGLIGVYSLAILPQTIILSDYRYSAKSTVSCISKYKCSDVWLVPAMIIDCNNFIRKRGDDMKIDTSSLETIGSGAAPCPVEVVKESQELFPSLKNVTIGYGATETTAISTFPNLDTPQSIMSETCGTPLDFVETKIVSAGAASDQSSPQVRQRVVKHNETGELLIRGHNIMIGYYGEPEKTAEVIDDGQWYHSGDLATMDSEGFIRIVGRTKELIIRGGSNVYPREIEELLHEHPGVDTAAVCGVPDPKLGEAICAWIKLRDNKTNIDSNQIKAFCRERISYYKVPEYIIFVENFPLTQTGKFQKFLMTQKSIEILGLKK